MVANVFPPIFSRTQSFLEEASGVVTKEVALSPKSPVSRVLTVVNADTCGGGLVVVDVGIILTLSILSRKSTIDEEVLWPEWMEWMSKGVSTSATKEGEELSSESLSACSVM